MMNKKIVTPLTAICLLSISGCTEMDKSLERTFARTGWEAGKSVDEGNFGNPNMNNTLAQLAYADQNGLILDLSRKFAKDVPSMINFDFNRSYLDAEARAILRQQANWIKQFPQLRFRVYGHTDLVGSARYNKRLGMARARAAVAFLVRQGININRLEAIVSYGETQPLVVTEGRERRNRRTVTEVSGFARNFVGTDMDGKYAHLVYQNYIAGGVPAEGTVAVVKPR